jgi:hypothetical protein
VDVVKAGEFCFAAAELNGVQFFKCDCQSNASPTPQQLQVPELQAINSEWRTVRVAMHGRYLYSLAVTRIAGYSDKVHLAILRLPPSGSLSPESATFVGAASVFLTFGPPYTRGSMAVQGGYVYISGTNSDGGEEIKIIDATTPANPKQRFGGYPAAGELGTLEYNATAAAAATGGAVAGAGVGFLYPFTPSEITQWGLENVGHAHQVDLVGCLIGRSVGRLVGWLLDRSVG